MLRRAFVVVLVHLTLAACSVALPGEPQVTTVERAGIQYRLETADTSYEQGQVVRLIYRITNTTSEDFHPGAVPDCEYCTHQFHATRDDQEVWRTCRVIPPCGQVEFSLAPGETWEWAEEWALTNDSGTMEPEDDFPLDPGLYTIVAELYLTSSAERVPVSLQIEVE